MIRLKRSKRLGAGSQPIRNSCAIFIVLCFDSSPCKAIAYDFLAWALPLRIQALGIEIGGIEIGGIEIGRDFAAALLAPFLGDRMSAETLGGQVRGKQISDKF